MAVLVSSQIYPILDPKERSRLALIICNINFAHLPVRKGAEVDLAEMTSLLESLGYTVEAEKDLCMQVISLGGGGCQVLSWPGCPPPEETVSVFRSGGHPCRRHPPPPRGRASVPQAGRSFC